MTDDQNPDLAAADVLGEVVPAKKVARKRATRKKAAAQPSVTADAPGVTEPTVHDGPATELAAGEAEPEPAQAKKATRKRAGRAKKSAATQAPDDGHVIEPGVSAPGGPTEPADRPAAMTTMTTPAAEDPTAEDPAAEDPADEDAVPEVPVALGIGAVLFQAPDPTAPVRRSRRAQAPAGPPAVSGDPVAGADQSPTSAVQEEPESAPADPADHDSDQDESAAGRKRRRRGGRGRRGRNGESGQSSEADQADDGGTADAERAPDSSLAAPAPDETSDAADDDAEAGSSSSRRRRRRRRRTGAEDGAEPSGVDEVASIKGSTRLEAKKQRRRDGRDAGRRKPTITEAEFLARRESVERRMVVREQGGRIQIGVLEDGVLVEHYVANETNASMIGNVYLGRVQNVLPSMEAAFIDIGKGRNAVLYAGEVNWDAAGLDGHPRRIEAALRSGDQVLVQVTKDPMGHKGARLTSQISLPGRYLVYVPRGSMTGISRKLPETERSRLKKILKVVVPEEAGVIVRTAAEGASEAELGRDVERLAALWAEIQRKSASSSGGSAPKLVHGELDLTARVIRDVFNEDFAGLVVSGSSAWDVVHPYVASVAPDLADRVSRWTSPEDIFAAHRIDEQLAKAMDRKVWLPSGGSLVIDRTEAMTVVDVNTGKFTGAGGNLEQTVTRNNLESAEEIVRQLRLRDIGGIIVIDFIDMVLESNRDLVLRRLLECLGRDRTKHQVAEVTSLGLVQMTRKRVGQGLLEVFSEPCEHCDGRGILLQAEPVSKNGAGSGGSAPTGSGKGDGGSGRSRGRARDKGEPPAVAEPASPPRQPMPAGLVASLTQPHDPPAGQQSPPAGEPQVVQPELVEPRVVQPRVVEPQVLEPSVAEPEATHRPVARAADGSGAGLSSSAPQEAAPASRPRRRRATAPAGPPAPHE